MRPEDIAWAPDALGRTGGAGDVSVRWLGAAGFALEHSGYVLLIDPYVTRASLARCLATRLRPNLDAVRRYTPRADAIVVGHTHFDHVLDVPAIAHFTGARVFGSRSAATLCRARGLPESRVEMVERIASEEPVVREAGPFELRFVPSVHSRLALGRVPFAGEIADCGDVPLRAETYRCGAVFGIEIRVAGRVFYHMGSAELAACSAKAARVDLLLMCVAGWPAGRDVPERVGAGLAPGALLLSHWDDFFRPLHRPARAFPAMQMPPLVERLSRAAPGVKIGTLPLQGQVWA